MRPSPSVDESSAGDAAKQLQQPPVARPVDAGRPRDHDFDARARRRLAGDALPFELRLLVDVAGLERRVFVRRGMLDVAVHADGAAVHHAARAAARGGLDHGADGVRIDHTVGIAAETRLPVDRRDVVDDVHAGSSAMNGRGVAKISHDVVDFGPAEASGRLESRPAKAGLYRERRTSARTSCPRRAR